MQTDGLVLPLIIAGVSILIGILLDNVIRLLFFNKDQSTHDQAAGGGSSAREPGQARLAKVQPHLRELVYLWEDPQDGSLVVEVDGETLRSAESLSASQRSLLEKSAERLDAWLGHPAPQEQPYRTNPAAPPPVPPASASTPSASTPSQWVMPQAGPVSPGPKTEKPALAPGFLSLAEQVDEVLQELLAASPLSRRQIKITEGPDKGIRVIVDLKDYDGIEEVPDTEVREILRAAVDEWRMRTSLR